MALVDEHAGEVDLIADAQAALDRAQRRVEALEEAIPLAQQALETARVHVLEASQAHLVASYATSKGVLPSDDIGIRAAEEAMFQAGRVLRVARQRVCEELPQALAAANGGVVTAKRQLFLTQHYPELLQALAEAEAQRPTDETAQDHYRSWSIWRQQMASARAAIDAAVREAGL